MADIFYDIETRELLDQNAPDQDVVIRTLHLSVGAASCECHGERIFHSAAPLAKHVLTHERIIGFNIIRFDNTVVAWSPDHSLGQTLEPETDNRAFRRSLPDEPHALKTLLDAKSFDLLADLEARLGHRVSLAAVAEATLGKQKSATGPQAVVWNRLATTLRDQWPFALADVGDDEGAQRAAELGTWFQQRLEEYCMADALLVKRIFDYGIANKRVAFVDFEGERRLVKVQWR